MSDVTAAIVAAIRGIDDLFWVGVRHRSKDEVAELVADRVARELGLRVESSPSGAVTDPVHGVTWYRQGGYRFVSDWVADE